MIEINNKTRSQIDLKLVKEITTKFLEYYKIKNKDISIAFVGDIVIKRLNKKYRQIDRTTDILAFPGEHKELGELIICYAQIKRQAKRFSPTERDELKFILVHGLLHLLGYEDKTQPGKKEMNKLTKKFLAKISY